MTDQDGNEVSQSEESIVQAKERRPFKQGDRVVLINLIGPNSVGLNNAKGKVAGPKHDGRHMVVLDIGLKKNILESNLDHDE